MTTNAFNEIQLKKKVFHVKEQTNLRKAMNLKQ